MAMANFKIIIETDGFPVWVHECKDGDGHIMLPTSKEHHLLALTVLKRSLDDALIAWEEKGYEIP